MQRPANRNYLPSPYKSGSEARTHAQTAPDRAGGTSAASAVAGNARQPNAAASLGHVPPGGLHVLSNKRPVSKTWVRPAGAEPPQRAVPQLPQAARPPAAQHVPAPSARPAPHNGAAGGVPRQVSSRLPASKKTWVRPDTALPAAGVQKTAATPAAEGLPGAARPPAQLPAKQPSNKVWTRDNGAQLGGVGLSSGAASTSAAVGAAGQATRGGDAAPNPAALSPPTALARQRQTGGTARPLRDSSAAMAPKRPRSLAWHNPDLTSALVHTAEPAAAAERVAAVRTASPASARHTAAGGLSSGARRQTLRTSGTGRQLPGVRAAALGRVVEGRVSKPRTHKLQRIGEHLYRARSGTSGRTLQRQGATPTLSARPARQVRLSSGFRLPCFFFVRDMRQRWQYDGLCVAHREFVCPALCLQERRPQRMAPGARQLCRASSDPPQAGGWRSRRSRPSSARRSAGEWPKVQLVRHFKPVHPVNDITHCH